ncbi:hypothetical protein ACFE04_015618 [Oxalis oulophora]
MGSSYFREPNLGNDSSSSSSSSRKGKKSNSDKPKQPQRGLGVAQLEKIRLHGQMGYPPSLHAPNNYPNSFNQEDMRVQGAYSSSFAYSSSSVQTASPAAYGYHHPNMMMGLGEYDRTNIGFGDSQPNTPTRWNPESGNLDAHLGSQPGMTRHLLNLHTEDYKQKKSNKHRSSSLGSSSQNSESSDHSQDLDLELRLSI